MKKITVIEYIGSLREGGAETLVKDYALLLNKELFNVVIVTNGPQPEEYENYRILRDAGATIVPIYSQNKVFKNVIGEKIWNRFFHRKYVSSRLLQICEEYKPKVMHFHLEVLCNVSPIRKRLKNVKLLFTCHSEPCFVFKKTRWTNEFSDAKKLIRDNDMQIIALHDEMKKQLNAMFGITNTIVLHNGINFHRFVNVPETKQEIQIKEGIPSNSFVIGNVGRLSEAKNHLYLIDIFNEVVKMRPNAHLLLVGSGPKENEIRKKLEDLHLISRCTIAQHRTDIPRLLKAMDVFLFPSIFEGLPVTMVEAQVAGLRIVVSENVTSECFFSENVIPMSIQDSPINWAKALLDNSIKGSVYNDINEFRMERVIENLQKLYMS